MEAQMSGIMVEVANDGSSHERPECGRERGTTETRSNPQSQEALEMELEIMKRELELRKARFANSSASSTQRTPEAHTSAETGWVKNQVNLNVIAELLPEFDGTMGDFRMWRNKLKILEQTYQLNDNHMKILVGLRLRRKALAWLHSADEYMLLSSEELLKRLGAMFDRQVDSMVLHEKFRARKWRKDESFSDYMHEKIILGNRCADRREADARIHHRRNSSLGITNQHTSQWCVHKRRIESASQKREALGQEGWERM
jgi:hypothetical protein